jgi:hypothetical protein
LETFGNHVESIVSQDLWEIFTHGKDTYYRIPKFCEHQTLKKDRKPSTYLFDVGSWKDAEDIGFHLEDIGNPREGKRRELKGTEGKEVASISYLSDIPQEKLKELTETYEASTSQVKKKALDLVNYCAAKGKTYKNYHAFLENALSKDFGRRAKLQPKVEEVEKPLDAEALARVKALKVQIGAVAKGMRA